MKLGTTLSSRAIVTAAILFTATIATAQSTPSGMLLGVYAFENFRGLRVTGTIPGYSAQGRLFRGDTLLRVSDGNSIFSARSRYAFEMATDQIGPNRWAALEVWRPGAGTIYFWVQFTPVGGGPVAASAPGAPPRQMRAEIRTDTERPAGRTSARSLFRRGSQAGGGNRQGGFGNGGRPQNNQGRSGGSDPRSLFGR